MPPLVAVTQLGFLCDARKRVVVDAAAFPGGAPDAFDVQDLALVDAEAFGEWENWKVVHRGRFTVHRGPMGDHLVGDLTALRRPGCYRIMLPEAAGWSHPFVVSDGAFSRLPSLFLDFVHAQRCGAFEDGLRGPCHLDDGVRSDTGEAVDVSGGWHDAGDLRKWMTTTPLPVLGFFALGDRMGFARNHWREKHFEDDALSEAAWGVRWVLKMQDPATGLFWEDVGGGGEARAVPGTRWWVDNHSGCVADNAGNVFTDNRKASGDERSVRVQYNPIAQYVATALLADAADRFHPAAPALARQSRDSALLCWKTMRERTGDAFHRWTSVQSWRLLAALRLHSMGVVAEAEVTGLVSGLLGLQAERGFFWMDADRRDPYRGIINAAQPAIGLC
ncbi:MAG: glycoside hydrolase family 9 protein, partial [Spirochaetes bacterium]|nr:glycoside hydrolase family 9 protein [Spirochaetota bacterium]